MAAQALEHVVALPAHAMIEAYSVLTRLPSGLAVPPQAAASVLAGRFSQAPLRLEESQRSAVLKTLADAGVFAGASYDGLVALEARQHGRTLLTLDRRAQDTYRRLGIAFSAIGS